MGPCKLLRKIRSRSLILAGGGSFRAVLQQRVMSIKEPEGLLNMTPKQTLGTTFRPVEWESHLPRVRPILCQAPTGGGHASVLFSLSSFSALIKYL